MAYNKRIDGWRIYKSTEIQQNVNEIKESRYHFE